MSGSTVEYASSFYAQDKWNYGAMSCLRYYWPQHILYLDNSNSLCETNNPHEQKFMDVGTGEIF